MNLNMQMNAAFEPAYKTKKRYRIIYGGAGSGKSHFVIGQETILNMLMNKDYRYLVVRKTGRSIQRSVYELLTSSIAEMGLSNHFKCLKSDYSIECVNGAKLSTAGLNDVERLKSITGVNRIIVEEASEITEKDFNQLDLRLRGKNKLGYQLTLLFNPISELHWIKRKFFDIGVEGTFILKTTFLDNSFLDDAYIRKLKRLEQEDYQFYRIYALGDWGSLGNLIFTNWEKRDLSEISEIFESYLYGGDWGFATDPFAATKLYFDKTRKTLYILDEIYRTEMDNEEAAAKVIPFTDGEYITMDSAEPKSISDFRKYGVNVRGAKKGKGSIEHGIKFMQGLKIIIDPSCVNHIREFSTYKYREDKDGNVIPKPVDAFNHLIDSIRYALEGVNNVGVGFLQ